MILMMSMYGENNTCLSLLNATKYFCNDDTLTQDHNSLNDAKLLKKLYNNIGEPNINNIIIRTINFFLYNLLLYNFRCCYL